MIKNEHVASCLVASADRAPNFEEPIEVQMLWNPPGINSQSEATIPKGATNVSYQLNASAGAEIRDAIGVGAAGIPFIKKLREDRIVGKLVINRS